MIGSKYEFKLYLEEIITIDVEINQNIKNITTKILKLL